MKSLKLLTLILLFVTVCHAQEEIQSEKKKSKINLPNIPGYLTLKCDLHMHTVFSDGHVWPTFRVSEAARAGLDAIAMTEHIDAENHADELNGRREYAYKIAQDFAKKKKYDVLLIKGGEISPRVPPYHNNALFLQDLDNMPTPYMKTTRNAFVMKDKIKKEELMAPFLEAKRQGAFTVYNHPNYNWWDGTHKDVFTPFHKELIEKGIMKGVEVVNGQRYNVFAHQIAEKYNLTMVAGSDAHEAINHQSGSNSHRPMTLVFAKDRTIESIKEAMLARRTAVYTREYVIGREAELSAFFKASLTMSAKKIAGKANNGKIEVKIVNNSDIPYQVYLRTPYLIDNMPLNLVTLQANSTTTVLLEPVWEYPKLLKLGFKVVNLLVGVEKSLETEVEVPWL